MHLTKNQETKLMQVYDTWWNSYLTGDVKTYDSFFDDNYHFIGSTNGEEYLNRKDTTAFFEATAHQLAGKAELRNLKRTIEQFECDLVLITDVADAYVICEPEWVFYSRFRFTSLMKETKNGWRFIYQHFSAPDTKAQEGETLGTEKITKENMELRDAIKRRTVELEHKAKELEIEAALERVRTVAMSMNKPGDMLLVCRMISEQLELLDIKEVRNVQTAIIYENRGIYVNYEYYRLHDKSLITEVDFHLHEAQQELVEKMQKGPDGFFSKSFSGQALQEWYAYQKTTTQFIDNYLENATSVNWYFYSLGEGGLGVSTYAPLNEEEIILFKRFRNVFELAYRRFLDIEKAIAQAREAQIELALERVRARTMAMQKSEELRETSLVLFQQLKELGEPVEQSTIGIFNEAQGVVEISATVQGAKLTSTFRHPISDPHVMSNIFNAWKNGQRSTTLELKGKELEAYNRYRNEVIVGEKMFPTKFSADDFRVIHVGYFSKGMLALSANETRPQESFQLLERFAAVFDQTYTRFLDLQKAEAQAREAEIELALERVRSQAMAMNKSSDLLDIVVTMRNEFTRLGHEAHYFWHMMWLPDKYEKAMTSGDGTRIGMVMELPRHMHGEIELLNRWEKSDEPLVVYPMDADTAIDYVDKMVILGDFKQVDPHAPTHDDIRHINGLTFVMARTTHGEIGYSLPGVVTNPPQEDLNILTRFAGAFDIAHRRFLDLQQSEAQALQIRQEKERLEITLSNLQATQKQLIQAEKMASLGELTAGIAHEIQNPLNFVNNFSEVSKELLEEMKAELDNNNISEAKEMAHDVILNLEKILHHGKRADSIVKGMLQHSRSSSGHKELTNINALADEYLRLAYHGLRAKDKSFNATLKADFDESIPDIYIIPQDIGRVILNLITNAFYAVNYKKKSGMENYIPIVSVNTKQVNGLIEISVTDNGNGIPKNILEKIYQPFFTTKPTGEGTGLGLSLSYDIVKSHGGELKVETVEGEGSTFTIVIPAH